MINIEWTEKLPDEHGYWLFQKVHKPKDIIHKRTDMEQGAQLIYVAKDEEKGMIYKESEKGIWRELPVSKGSWKAEYSTECFDLNRMANFDY